jgi:hypothetical protein
VLVHAGVSPGAAIGTALALFAAAAVLLGLGLVSLTGSGSYPSASSAWPLASYYSGGPLPISFSPSGNPSLAASWARPSSPWPTWWLPEERRDPPCWSRSPRTVRGPAYPRREQRLRIEGDHRAAGRAPWRCSWGRDRAPGGGFLRHRRLRRHRRPPRGGQARRRATARLSSLGSPLRLSSSPHPSPARAPRLLHERKSAVMRAVTLAFLIHNARPRRRARLRGPPS